MPELVYLLQPVVAQFWLSGPRFFPGRPGGSPARGRAEQIDEKTVTPGDSFGQLPEEGQTRINVSAFAIAGVDKTAVEDRLAGIVHSEERCVFRIELRPKIKTAFLYPALEIILRDFVGPVEKRIIRPQKFDW